MRRTRLSIRISVDLLKANDFLSKTKEKYENFTFVPIKRPYIIYIIYLFSLQICILIEAQSIANIEEKDSNQEAFKEISIQSKTKINLSNVKANHFFVIRLIIFILVNH